MPSSEIIGILAAIVILLIAFGSVIAMGLPIVTALIGVAIATAGVGIVANVFTTPDVRAAGRVDDRPRRRHRLRAVHRHPLPRGARSRRHLRSGVRRGHDHRRSGRRLRRVHRDDLDPRHVPHGHRLPARTGRRHVAGRRHRRARRHHPAAGAARLRRRQDQPAPGAPPTGTTGGSVRGTAGPASCSAGPSPSPSSASPCWSSSAVPVFALHLGFADAGNDPRAPRPAPPTTSWPRASAPARTARSSSSPTPAPTPKAADFQQLLDDAAPRRAVSPPWATPSPARRARRRSRR